MRSPQWRDRLAQQLYRQRLPTAYIDRVVEELTEHATDLFMETNSMDAELNLEARLGNPEQLARLAKREYQRRTFAGRHPVATFVAGPLVALVGTFLLSCLLVFAIYWLIDLATGGSLSANDGKHLPPSSLEMRLIQIFNFTTRFVPFALSAWLFVRLGRRSGLRAWSLTACGIVSVVAAFFTSIVAGGPDNSQGTWTIGLSSNIGLDQLVQAAVPVALGAWTLWQSPRNHSKAHVDHHRPRFAASSE
jgi:hypothetical protein